MAHYGKCNSSALSDLFERNVRRLYSAAAGASALAVAALQYLLRRDDALCQHTNSKSSIMVARDTHLIELSLVIREFTESMCLEPLAQLIPIV